MSRKLSKKYKFYSDAGHGWLAVKIQDLIDLDISFKISPYSYIRGKTAYLEEDSDYSIFIQTLKNKNIPYEIVSSKNQPDRSPIRSYDSYQYTTALNNLGKLS